MVSEIPGPYRMCHMSKEGNIIALKKDKSIGGYQLEVYQMNPETHLPTKIKEIPVLDQSKPIYLETSEDLLTITFHSRKIWVMDLHNVSLMHSFLLNPECDSPPFILGKYIYFIPFEGVVCKVDFTKPEDIKTLSLLNKDVIHPSVKMGYVSEHTNTFVPFYMGFIFLEEDRELAFFKTSILEVYKASTTFFDTGATVERHEVSRQKLTCCGIDISYVS